MFDGDNLATNTQPIQVSIVFQLLLGKHKS